MNPAHGDQTLATTTKEDLIDEPRSKQRKKQYRQRQRQKAKIQKAKITEQEGVAQDVVGSAKGADQSKGMPSFLSGSLILKSCSDDGRKLALFANVLRSIYQRHDFLDVEINVLGAQLTALEVRLNAVQKEEKDLLELYLKEFSDESRYLCREPLEYSSEE